MVKGNLTRHYSETHLTSSSPQETVLMLYDGVIRFLKDAAREITGENITAKIHLLEKVEKIVEYLQSCLDKENGGEIADNLDNLYDYILIRLTEANLNNDLAKLEEIVNLVYAVREGWASVCEAAKKGQVPDAETGSPQASTKKIAVSI